jgi:hypothetical protein
MNRSQPIDLPDTAWRGLYRAGGAAALVAVLFFRRNFGAELIGFRGFGLFDVPAAPPVTAAEWFTLLQHTPFVGLALLGLVDLVNYVLVGLLFLALYGALRRANKSAMVVATALAFVGIAVYLASNPAFSMLALSHQYAAASTEARRAALSAAGEALLAIDNPGVTYQGTGTYASLLLVLLAGLVVSVVMLRSDVFGRAAAYVGLLANGLALGYFVALAVAPAYIALPMVASAPFRVVWYVLIALRLFRLGRVQKEALLKPA